MFEMRAGYRATFKSRGRLVTKYILDEHDIIVAKKCNRCLEIKGLEQFLEDAKKFDGRQSICKECDKKYYTENKDHIAKRAKKYYVENKERIAERQRKQDAEKREQLAEHRRKYDAEKRKRLAKWDRYYEEKKERVAERQKKYREENKESIAERRRMKKSE